MFSIGHLNLLFLTLKLSVLAPSAPSVVAAATTQGRPFYNHYPLPSSFNWPLSPANLLGRILDTPSTAGLPEGVDDDDAEDGEIGLTMEEGEGEEEEEDDYDVYDQWDDYDIYDGVDRFFQQRFDWPVVGQVAEECNNQFWKFKCDNGQ